MWFNILIIKCYVKQLIHILSKRDIYCTIRVSQIKFLLADYNPNDLLTVIQ